MYEFLHLACRDGDRSEALLAAAMERRPSTGGSPPPPVLTSITVTPTNPTWRPTTSGDRQQFTATGHYSSGPDQDITTSVTWSSATPGTATISNGAGDEGEATAVSAVGAGAAAATTLIEATLGAVVGSTTLSVDTDRDATSSKRVPANAYQWSLLGITNAHTWLCQEASGNLADANGALTLTANGTVAYQQAVTGWTRTAAAITETGNSRFGAAAAAGPNPATTSVAWLVYGAFTVSAAARGFLMAAESTNDLKVDIFGGATPGFRINVNAVTANSTATGYADGVARPFLLQYNRTAGSVRVLSTKPSDGTSEVLNGTYAAGIVDGTKGIGTNGTTAAPMRSLYLAAFTGAAAEGLSAATLTLLGW